MNANEREGTRMTLELVTPPAELAIALADVKAHLRVDCDDDDALITAYVQAAAAKVEDDTGRALIEQTWRLTLPRWPVCHDGRQRIYVPRPPLLSVESLSYIDAAGDAQALVEDVDFSTYPDHAWFAALGPVYGTNWPAVRSQPDAIVLEFKAGFETAADLAEREPLLVAAVRLLVAELYAQREEAAPASRMIVPLAARRLIATRVVHASGAENE